MERRYELNCGCIAFEGGQPQSPIHCKEHEPKYTPTVAMRYLVKIIEIATGEVVKTMQARTPGAAERVKRGVEINLNHDEFKVLVESEPINQEEQR